MNAALYFDRMPPKFMSQNNMIYVAHSSPDHVWNHPAYFGENREARIAALSNTKRLVCLSEDHVDEFAERLNYPRGRIRVVGHTVEIDPKTSTKLPQRTIGIICRLENQSKRIDRFLLVAQAMPDYQFHIYGTGPDEDDIRAAVENIPNVVIHGPSGDIEAALEKIGVLLVTSDYEGFGITIVEALSQATPVVIGKNSFSRARDLITDDYNGFVCEAFSVAEVAEKIEIVLSSYERFSTNALQSFSRYDKSKFISDWTTIFDELANQ